jgi:hypothetical protein
VQYTYALFVVGAVPGAVGFGAAGGAPATREAGPLVTQAVEAARGMKGSRARMRV